MRSDRAIVVGLVLACVAGAQAVNIETVTVGNPGNAGELSGEGAGGWGPDRICGSVGYTYNIGKYEVTAGQYTEFLNAVAATDAYGLYHERMWENPYYPECGIQRHGVSGGYTYSVAADWANRPVNYVTWGDAARFCNWMHNGQPTGGQGFGTTEDGSYYLNGATSNEALLAVVREPGATWVIPSEDEWYKAAYHKNDDVSGNYWDYPTSSDTCPGLDMGDASGNNANYYTGLDPYPIDPPYYTTVAGEFQNSDSPYGTFDQGGNVWEWNEAVLGATYRGARGGSFAYSVDLLRAANRYAWYHSEPAHGDYDIGFRVADVPEPACLSLLALGGLACLGRRHQRF